MPGRSKAICQNRSRSNQICSKWNGHRARVGSKVFLRLIRPSFSPKPSRAENLSRRRCLFLTVCAPPSAVDDQEYRRFALVVAALLCRGAEHISGRTATQRRGYKPSVLAFLVDHRSTLVASDDVMRMRPRSQNRQSIGSLSWTKRLLSLWNLENIKVVKRVIVSVVGATVLLIGVALLILPGPAFIVIPIGLAILATEYAWARRWLRKVRRMASDVVSSRDRTAPRDSRI